MGVGPWCRWMARSRHWKVACPVRVGLVCWCELASVRPAGRSRRVGVWGISDEVVASCQFGADVRASPMGRVHPGGRGLVEDRWKGWSEAGSSRAERPVRRLVGVEVALLGPLSVTVAEGQVSVGSPKERAVLSLLALRGANGCPAAELVAALWGDRAPRSAAKTLQTYVSKLRQVLPAGVIATTSNGYVLVVAPDAVDVARFETAVAVGRDLVGAGDRAGAVAAFAGGLRLWRGRALVDLVDQPAGMADAARLEELRRSIEEELAELRLALGQHQALVADLEAAVAAEPLRERRWVQLMLALYRSGRQADALRAFQRLRRILADELGLEPGIETRAVEAAILAQDAGLSLGVGGGDLGQPVDTGPPTGNGASLFADLDGPGASAQFEELHLGAVDELALTPGPGPPQLEFTIPARDSSLGLPAPAEVPVTIEAGRTGPAAAPAGRHRRPIVVAAGALVAGALVAGALVLVGVVVKSSGGRAAPVVIPADAVGAISPSAARSAP